jgi:SNF2 family DNA or RNA helicase
MELASKIKITRKKTAEKIKDEIEKLQKKLASSPYNPKIDFIKELLQKSNYNKIAIYSHYIAPLMGLADNLEIFCKKKCYNKYAFFKITGKEVSVKKRQGVVDEINKIKNAIIFLSDAGGVGLDFKGIEAIIIYEPGINISREEQAIGRAVRFDSHVLLPIEKQKVDIYRLIMIFPSKENQKLWHETKYNFFDNEIISSTTADQIILKRSVEKETESMLFRQRLEELNNL